MKRLALCALSAMVCQIAFAQDSGKTLVNELVSHWETSKALSLAVAEAMPALFGDQLQQLFADHAERFADFDGQRGGGGGRRPTLRGQQSDMQPIKP